jgi:hypothetical protein
VAEILDINQMLANEYEPKRSWQWVLEIDGIDSFTAKTASRPNKKYEEITLDWMNQKIYHSAKGSWEPIEISLYDPIAPSQCLKVMEWMKLVHDDTTGRMGYASIYKKTFTLKICDGGGLVIEKWKAVGAWPTNIDLGKLDYADASALAVSFTCRCDRWIQEF